MLLQLRLFFVALQFLTRVPIPRWVGFEPAWLNSSARYFPVVGTLVGLVAAGVLWVAGLAFPPSVAAGLSIAATVLMTGAFHEDGLADTSDALGGHVSRERALEIMKDSRIGTYGAVAIVLVLGLKTAALTAMRPALAIPAYVLAHTLSRAVPVILLRHLSYVGSLEHAKAKPMARHVACLDVSVALLWAAAVCGAIFWLEAERLNALGASLLLSAAVTLTSARWLRKRLGGYTGDTLGATQQITELVVLFAWLGIPSSWA
jgi:adenosylcobinamide-GDP ribazoletransferase